MLRPPRLLRRYLPLLTIAAALALVSTALAQGFTYWDDISQAISYVPSDAGPVYDDAGSTDSIQVVNFGTVVYTGPVDVSPTLDRIRANQKLPHNNDGTIWDNHQALLPDAPYGYYHEFVHWPYSTSAHPYGMNFPGPMRVVLGGSGEVYFTGDHYVSFYYVN